MSVMLTLLVSESAVTAPRAGQLRLSTTGGAFAAPACPPVGRAPGVWRRLQSRERRIASISATLSDLA
jgi:hypothetical protein